MAKVKVPSLQHLARLWRPDPLAIKRVLIGLAEHGPTFSYEPLYEVVRDMLVLRVPYEQILEGIERGVKREDVKARYLSILPLIRMHFENISASFVQQVSPRFYPVGRDLLVPFRPPLIYGAEGQIHFPWFSFWQSNPLASEQLSLFVTIVEEVLLQDSDLEDAKFSILDFSAPSPKEPRQLTVLDAKSIPRLSDERKTDMLSIFAEGFRYAKLEAVGSASGELQPSQSVDVDETQISLFK